MYSFINMYCFHFRMPENRIVVRLQKCQIDDICKSFIQKNNAFYHPVTRKLSYIIDGHCIKGECTNRHSERKGFGDRKILVPLQIREHFRTTVDNICSLPLSKIGQVVICLSHFFVEHQKAYLRDGVLPPEARLVGVKEIGHVEGKRIPELPPFPLRDATKGNKAWRGYKVSMTTGLSNTDWVNGKKWNVII